MTWHLSSRHNMEYDHTIPMGLPHHQPFITAPHREDGAQHGYLSSRHNARYGNAIMWSRVPHGHSLPRHGIGMMRGKMTYRH